MIRNRPAKEGYVGGEEIGKDGRAEEIRTPDPFTPSEVRYQTALRPEPKIKLVSVAVSSIPGQA